MNKIYDGLSFEMYQALPGCSVSRAKALASYCPAYVAWLRDHERETDSIKLGKALHHIWLEANDGHYQKKLDGRTKEGKAQVAEVPGERLISGSDWDCLQGMLDSLGRSKLALSLNHDAKYRELSAHFDYAGALCKMRADAVVEAKLAWDLKTINDVSDASINRAILNYRYYWQAWFYSYGLQQLDIYAPHFGFVFVQSKAPHYVRFITLSPGWYALAEQEMAPIIQQYDECEQADKWAGYPDKFEDVELPAWKDKQLEYAYEAEEAA